MGVDVLVRKVLAEIGIKPERFSLQWASAAEAPRFVKLITDFTLQMKELGPIGKAEGLEPDEVRRRINNALDLVSNRKLRVGFGNATKTIRKDGDFSSDHITEVIDGKLSNTIATGLIEAGLLSALEQSSPATLESLVEKTGAPREQAEKILETLTKQGKVALKDKKWTLAAAA